MKKYIKTVIMLCLVCISSAACDQFDMSPRKKVVKEAIRSVCSQKNIEAIEPYVTESSKSLIQLAATFSKLGEATGLVQITDSIAIACADTQVKVLDEVKVSDVRYIVRARLGEENAVENFTLVLEQGNWKIALIGN
ncbi:MAG: hypothetical protein LW731_12985 [Oxalobacteraceae bacterium]|jgi:hypothetical protein|nr:hypothetical protein [Oxalobacteraceae bacterium]